MASTTDKNREDFLLLSGLIGFVFSFRTCLTILWFQDDPQQATILSASLSLTLLVLAAFCSAGATPSIASSSFRTTPIRWLSALLGLALLSLLWSEAPLTAAFGYWASWTADVAAVWLVLRSAVPAERQAKAIMKGFVWGASIVAIVAWATPAANDLRLGNEDFLHPNALGFLFAIATFLAIHLARNNQIWRWPAFFLATTLLRTISKTSIIAFLAAFAFYLLWDSSMARIVKIRIGIAAGIILVSLWGVLETYLDNYTQGTGPETLTGRTLIWAVSFEYALKKPLLGNGFYAYRFIVPHFDKFEAWQSHDELLQQFFSFGILGIIVFIGIYWAFFRQLRRARNSNIKTLAATLLVFALVRGIADTENFDLSYPLWLMTMLSVLLASMPRKDQPSQSIPQEA
jgi:exopolysaccharide production protein ExoQ